MHRVSAPAFCRIAAASLVVGLAGCESLGGHSSGGQSDQDNLFFQKAAETDMFEIQSSQLALSKASNGQTKTFAQQMIEDHTRTSMKLQSLAAEKGVGLPTKLDSEKQDLLSDLNKQSGSNFDSLYMKDQVAGHQTAVQAFETEVDAGKDKELIDFAQTTLPTIRGHLNMARGMQRNMAM